MSNQIIRAALMLLLSFSVSSQLLAQNIVVDATKLEKSYSADFSNPFNISFKDSSKRKMNVVLKQGEIPIVLKENADLSTYKIEFSPAEKGMTVTDKDNKKKDLLTKSFTIVLGEKSFKVNPSIGVAKDSNSNDITVDMESTTKTYEPDFNKNFKLSFKTDDTKPKDVIISTTSAGGGQTLSLKQKDLTKLQILFVSEGGVITIGDGAAKSAKDDAGKVFKVDDGKFIVKVGEKTLTVSKKSAIVKKDEPVVNEECKPVTIIDNAMLAGINGAGGCQLCDIRAKKEAIESKNDRIYSTDYIVIYDPMLKKDAYSICKHVFQSIEKKDRPSNPDKKYFERYIKIGAKWFAPSVGSQIRFEVVNLPLSSTLKLSVDENDVFNGGASQFASIINSLVSTNIVGPIAGTGKLKDSTTKATGGEEVVCFLSDIDHIATELLKYMMAFRISSCAIEQHNRNLPVIFSRINERFELSAATAEQLGLQLTQKIDEKVDNDNKVKAIKKAELIVNALQALEKVTPLAYTTLRAKNRDYIEVKYTDGNNVQSKPENIRMSGGIKIDFSAGFVLTGLRDYSYLLKNSAFNYTPPGTGQSPKDTTGNIIIKEDEGNNQVGVGLLTHFYPRLSSHYNIGGTVGLMTSTSLNLRLMLGGSLMVSSLFGSNNRVSFSSGIVWGKVKRLSKKDEDFYNGPRIVNGVPEFFTEASAPQPIDRNEHSWFFAVTMNFGGN